DSNGEYFFGNLVPSDYSVKPVQAGTMFAPLNPVVRMDNASRIVNFNCGIAPAISSITVVGSDGQTISAGADGQRSAGNNPDAFAVFGTSEVSLKIDGSNFVAP